MPPDHVYHFVCDRCGEEQIDIVWDKRAPTGVGEYVMSGVGIVQPGGRVLAMAEPSPYTTCLECQYPNMPWGPPVSP
jgi:hypothetical protein